MKIQWIFCVILLALLTYWGHYYRSISYDLIPTYSFVSDERTNVSHGLSIRKTGVPSAWSDLRSYWDIWPKEKSNVEEKGVGYSGFNITLGDQSPTLFPRNFENVELIVKQFDFGQGKFHTVLVQPYLDHPPLGAIILSLLVSGDIKEFDQITPWEFRKVSVYLASLTTILIFLFGYQLANKWVGLISAGVYVSVPTFLIVSRMALLENVLIPVMLVALNLYLFAWRYKSNSRVFNVLLFLMGLVAGVAVLTKVIGFAVIVIISILLLWQKLPIKKYLIFLIPAAFVSSIYFIWGMFLSPALFLNVLEEQSTRRIFVGSLNFLTAFIKFGMGGFPFDGWWLGGFVTLLLLKFNDQTKPLIVSFVVMLFLILFTGASSFPWYFIPLIPFLCVSVGYFLYQLIVKPNTVSVLIFFLLFFSSSYFWGYGVEFAAPNFNNHQQQFVIYKILISLFFGLALFAPRIVEKYKRLQMLWIIGFSGLLLVTLKLNFMSILFILQNWGKFNNFISNWQF